MPGKGASFTTSIKQKINMQSSTKSMLAGDNQSALRLEKNGNGSSDRMAVGELTIKYYPTEFMLADFYTKPLQEKLVRLFCNRTLNFEKILVLLQQ
eukprot:7277295-Ditylum_brightwellii.AAC.1